MANSFDILTIRTLIVPGSINVPDGSFDDADIAAGAGLTATKLERRLSVRESQANGTANVARRTVLHFVHGTTGTLVALYARNTTTPTTTSTTVDLYKNGSTILSAPLVLTAAETTVLQSTTAFTSAALVAGDVLEVVITVSGATPGQGIAVELVCDEDPE